MHTPARSSQCWSPQTQHGLEVCIWMHLVNGTGDSPSPGQPTPGVVKQDKSSGGSVDTTKTRSGPQRVRMSSGERPIGAAKGKQSDAEALCQPPAPRPPLRSRNGGPKQRLGGPSFKERKGRGSEWRSASRRRRLQTRTTNPWHGVPTSPPSPPPTASQQGSLLKKVNKYVHLEVRIRLLRHNPPSQPPNPAPAPGPPILRHPPQNLMRRNGSGSSRPIRGRRAG